MGLLDKPVSMAAFPFLNKLLHDKGFADIGRLSKLSIDSTKKVIDIEVFLEGEVAPVSVAVSGYSFRASETEPDKFDLRWSSVHVSRPWMQGLADRFEAKTLKVPRLVGKMLNLMI